MYFDNMRSNPHRRTNANTWVSNMSLGDDLVKNYNWMRHIFNQEKNDARLCLLLDEVARALVVESVWCIDCAHSGDVPSAAACITSQVVVDPRSAACLTSCQQPDLARCHWLHTPHFQHQYRSQVSSTAAYNKN